VTCTPASILRDARRRALQNTAAAATFLEGVKPPEGLPMPNIDCWQNTTAGYVDTMGIPVVEGRAFLPSDADGPFVVLINQALARTWYPGVDPIGRRVRAGGPNTPWFTIVGS
jgi:hypothetical protein